MSQAIGHMKWKPSKICQTLSKANRKVCASDNLRYSGQQAATASYPNVAPFVRGSEEPSSLDPSSSSSSSSSYKFNEIFKLSVNDRGKEQKRRCGT